MTSVFHAFVLLLIMNFVITLSKWLWIRRLQNWLMKNWREFVFAITNCQIVRSHSLTHCINYKFMCLSAYSTWKLPNKGARISAVIENFYSFLSSCFNLRLWGEWWVNLSWTYRPHWKKYKKIASRFASFIALCSDLIQPQFAPFSPLCHKRAGCLHRSSWKMWQFCQSQGFRLLIRTLAAHFKGEAKKSPFSR